LRLPQYYVHGINNIHSDIIIIIIIIIIVLFVVIIIDDDKSSVEGCLSQKATKIEPSAWGCTWATLLLGGA
jgi:hypothetical protein